MNVEAVRAFVTVAEEGQFQLAAAQLGVGNMTVIRLIKANVLPAKQSCPGAPYVIRQEDLQSLTVRRAVGSGRAVSNDSRQKVMEYE